MGIGGYFRYMIYNCNKVFDIKGLLVWIVNISVFFRIKKILIKYKIGYSYEKIIKWICFYLFYLIGVFIVFDCKSFEFFYEIEKGYNLY